MTPPLHDARGPGPRAVVDEIDIASAASFPASDPPAWSPLHVGGPQHDPAVERATGPERKTVRFLDRPHPPDPPAA